MRKADVATVEADEYVYKHNIVDPPMLEDDILNIWNFDFIYVNVLKIYFHICLCPFNL